jgi:DNA-binding Lrp family transcriptional regulator|tara:strand:+ start:1103 stop:1354 length:252 start_codon:yes stop_codon:yes gene_type:complete
MYFHPLQEEIGNMSEEEISKRIKELTRKVAIARRGRNPELLANLQHALATYRDAIRQRRVEEWHKNNKKLRDEPDIGDLINIE